VRPSTRDAAQPEGSTRPDERDRETEYEKRKAELSNAWRSPSGIARVKPTQIGGGPASMVEPDRRGPLAIGEQWKGGA
jgi:hypothetical protein